MTEGNMTGRPYGGTNDPGDSDVLPGERPASEEEQQVEAAPEESPRAARGPMGSGSDPGSGVPGSATGPQSSGPPDAGTPGS